MRALAVELAPHGIRRNSIAPRAVDTQREASAGAMLSTLADRPIRSAAKAGVDDIAGAVRLLAGPQGAYVTGQTIQVNGGLFLP